MPDTPHLFGKRADRLIIDEPEPGPVRRAAALHRFRLSAAHITGPVVVILSQSGGQIAEAIWPDRLPNGFVEGLRRPYNSDSWVKLYQQRPEPRP